MTDLFDEWNTRLEAEGLGVIDPIRNWDDASKDIKHIKGKHKRLDALVNEPAPSARMTNSPVTARGSDTRFIHAADFEIDLDDGLHDIDEDADNAWDLLMLSFIATPTEAAIADRQRASVLPLTSEQKVVKPKLRRRTKAQKAANIRARQRGLPEPYPANPYIEESPELEPVTYAVPKPQRYLGDLGIPCASADAGGGPLAVPTRPKPDRGSPRRDDELRPSPVVGCDGYLPGRSPFERQLAQRGVRNSDITG
jgi:hypothetical protein